MTDTTDSKAIIRMDSVDDYLSDNSLTAVEQFQEESTSKGSKSSSCCPCFSLWWNGKFKHQRFIVHVVEKTAFHIAIIVLVLVDCLLVVGELMLDFIYLSEKCQNRTRTSDHSEHDAEENSVLELSIEILHFGSVALLSIFVLEVLVKLYAFGKHWWDYRERKMEWLDALIVVISFTVDIYFINKPNVVAEISLLFISLRLWRIIRIINSIAQSVRSKDEKTRKLLAITYKQIIDLLLDVSTKKTEAISELRQDLTIEKLDLLLEKLTSVDQSCRSIPATTSQYALTGVAQNLQETLDQIRTTSTRLSLKTE